MIDFQAYNLTFVFVHLLGTFFFVFCVVLFAWFIFVNVMKLLFDPDEYELLAPTINKVYKIALTLGFFIAFVFAVVSVNNNAPKYALKDNFPPKTVEQSDAEFKNLAPKPMTDEERLEYNRRLYGENTPK